MGGVGGGLRPGNRTSSALRVFWVRVFPYGVGGAGRVWRRPTSRTSAALDTAAVGSMSLVIFDDPAARLIVTVTYRSPTLRALLSLLSHSELTVLEGSSGSDDGPVVSVVPEVI